MVLSLENIGGPLGRALVFVLVMRFSRQAVVCNRTAVRRRRAGAVLDAGHAARRR